MREIKFRGIRLDTREWVYGDLHHGITEITYSSYFYINGWQVDAKTVGQYTGLPDKCKTDIYESDIVKQGKSIGIIVFESGRFEIDWLINPEEWSNTLEYHAPYSVVMGDIFNNPDLLEVR